MAVLVAIRRIEYGQSMIHQTEDEKTPVLGADLVQLEIDRVGWVK